MESQLGGHDNIFIYSIPQGYQPALKFNEPRSPENGRTNIISRIAGFDVRGTNECVFRSETAIARFLNRRNIREIETNKYRIC